MKLVVVSLLSLMTLHAHAASLESVFKNVTYTKPKCYGREYSSAELAKNKNQTVEQIKAKFMRYSADLKESSEGLKIEVRLKKQEGLSYHAEFSCMNYEGKLRCGIECDGGSVEIGTFDEKTMTLKNNGFLVKGGCGEDEVEKYLESKKGADDLFKLYALPSAFCSDANTHFD